MEIGKDAILIGQARLSPTHRPASKESTTDTPDDPKERYSKEAPVLSESSVETGVSAQTPAPVDPGGTPVNQNPTSILVLENPVPPPATSEQTLETALKEAVSTVVAKPAQSTRGISPTFNKPEVSFLDRLLGVSKSIGNAFLSLVGSGDPAHHLRAEQKQVLALEAKYAATDPETGEYLIPDLSVKTAEFRELLKSGQANLDQIRVEAYAVAREACARELGMRHYECQVAGALAMDQGSIAEMKTGEGKTLTAVLPLYLNALATDDQGRSKGAHLITVNEHLADRDGEWMRPAFEALGMTLGVVTEQKEPEEKRAAYAADITYATNNAVGFDYLRDQMVHSPEERVQRGLHYALVDEVDMVLIDEANTPLILSSGTADNEGEYRNFDRLVRNLRDDGSDFQLSNKEKFIYLTDQGLDYVETHLAFQDARREEMQAQVESKLQHDLLAETEAAAVTRSKEEELLKTVTAEDSGPEEFRAFKDAVRKGAFEFLDQDTRRRLQREGPRPGDLKRIGVTLENAREVHEKLLPTLHEKAQSTAGHHQAVVEKTRKAEKALEALLDLRLACDEKEKLALERDYQEAKAEAPEFNLYDEKNMHRAGYLENALKSRFLFHEGEDYLVEDNEVKIVDAFKGRMPEGRRFSYGLHQALEAKEDVPLNPLTQTSASVTYPNLFKLYEGSPDLRDDPDSARGLAGMSGTAVSEAEEFFKLYGVEVVAIETNKPVILRKHPDVYFRTNEEKVAAVVDRAEELFRSGKPVLIGTVSVENNKYVASQLAKRGIPCQVLNAENVRGRNEEEIAQVSRESQMISNAGHSGMVTVATNMAGRGVNVKPDWIAFSKLSSDVMREALPLGRMASGFERLLQAGKSGVVDVGSVEAAQAVTQYFRGERLPARVSPEHPGKVFVGTAESRETLKLEDYPARPVVVDVAEEKEVEKLRHWLDNSGVPVQVVEGESDPPPAGTVQIRVLPTEESRKQDPELYEFQGPRAAVPEGVSYFPAESYFTGGLHVLATERHESPRIDRQLVGRAGRQGAPGSYQFFLSLQDQVLRYFGGEKLEKAFEKVFQKQAAQPGQGISDDRLDQLVTKAQKSVGGVKFDGRDRSNEFDKTNDKHRESFYAFRADVVDGTELKPYFEEWTVRHYMDQLQEHLPGTIFRGWTPEEVSAAQEKAAEKLGFDFPVELGLRDRVNKKELEQAVSSKLKGLFALAQDGGKDARLAILKTADRHWCDHLVNLDELQESIEWEALAEKDPKQAYIPRAFEVFQGFVDRFEEDAIKSVVSPLLREAAHLPVFFGGRAPLLRAQSEPLKQLALKAPADRVEPESERLLDAQVSRAVDLEFLPAEARFWAPERQTEAIAGLGSAQLFHSYEPEAGESGSRPTNPRGPTGKSGRGDFARFGANFCSSAVLVRRHLDTGKLQLLVKPEGAGLALPGGAVEYGQALPREVARDLAVSQLPENHGPNQLLAAERVIAGKVDSAETLYAGAIDHPDNRDQAWWELKAVTLEVPENLEPSSDSAYRWQDVSLDTLKAMESGQVELVHRAVEAYQDRTGFKVAHDGVVGRLV